MALVERLLGREGQGWLIVSACSIIVGMGLGSLFSISVFLKPLATEFGWPRGDTAFAYSSAAILNGLCGIGMGFLADRIPVRRIVMFGAVVVGCSLILLSFVQSLWQLYLLFGPMLGGLGLSAFLIPMLTVVGFWVQKNRGVAIGIVMAGQSLGGALVPMVARYLISTVGWREAYIWMGSGFLLIALPLALLIREAPGAAEARAASRRAVGENGRDTAIDPNLLTMALCAAITLCCICMSVPVVHLISTITDTGISAAGAAGVMAAMMLVSVMGRVGVGKVADYIGGVRALLAFSAVQTLFVFWFTQIHSLQGLFVIAVLFGIGYGGIIPAYAIIVREYMPVHRIGGATGLVFFFGNIGMGTGGYLGGLLFDLSGSYTLPYATAAAAGAGNLLVVGALLIYLSGRRGVLRASAAEA